MAQEYNKGFKNSSKHWICDNSYADDYVKIRDNCNITGKYRSSAHRHCNINVKLSHRIPVIFYNLKNYDFNLILQELGKFDLRINGRPNGLEKYISFSVNSKLIFIDSF